MRASDLDLQLDQDDIRMEKVELEKCAVCDDRAVTHQVVVDLRAIGTSVVVERCCRHCATDTKNRLRRTAIATTKPRIRD